ncbi:MAG: alpha/beta hydrolase [Clostridia bacterium]|nr:alpha/beta hydrolase [Clostridia bacterium]
MSYLEVLNNKKADIDVFYKSVGDLSLPLQVFLPDEFDEEKTYKTIIAIHGGGWHSLTETPVDWNGSWMAGTAKHYARKGYVGIVFSYRDLELDESCDVGDLLADCRDAMEYIKTNFSFVNADNVVLMGDSAGAHLALCLGMCLPCGEKSALMPSKIAAYNPVTDCVSEKWNYCAKDAEMYSPMNNIKSTDAEILVMHGTADAIVDINDNRLFTKKMKEAGNNISMVEIPDAGHAFILFGYKSTDEEVLEALRITDEIFDL